MWVIFITMAHLASSHEILLVRSCPANNIRSAIYWKGSRHARVSSCPTRAARDKSCAALCKNPTAVFVST